MIEVKATPPACAQLHGREGEQRPIKFGAVSFDVRRMLSNLFLRGHLLPVPFTKPGGHISMRIYYFDLKDGVPTRDRKGIAFPSAAAAIAHSKELAQRLRDEPRIQDPALAIVVIDESGTEIHCEPVYPGAAKPGMSIRKVENFNRID